MNTFGTSIYARDRPPVRPLLELIHLAFLCDKTPALPGTCLSYYLGFIYLLVVPSVYTVSLRKRDVSVYTVTLDRPCNTDPAHLMLTQATNQGLVARHKPNVSESQCCTARLAKTPVGEAVDHAHSARTIFTESVQLNANMFSHMLTRQAPRTGISSITLTSGRMLYEPDSGEFVGIGEDKGSINAGRDLQYVMIHR